MDDSSGGSTAHLLYASCPPASVTGSHNTCSSGPVESPLQQWGVVHEYNTAKICIPIHLPLPQPQAGVTGVTEAALLDPATLYVLDFSFSYTEVMMPVGATTNNTTQPTLTTALKFIFSLI